MPTLIDRHGRREDRFVRLEAAASGAATDAVAPDAAVLLTLAEWKAHTSRWAAHAGPVGVVLGPADDPEDIAVDLPRLSLVAVDFPAFTDGRGYSTARLLRERFGWAGELRAVGDVLRDQLFFYARCGFDTFALKDGVDVDAAIAAFAEFTEAYQGAVDRAPLYARRLAGAAADAGNDSSREKAA